LFGMEVILHPELLAGRIDPQVGVGAIAIHVPPRAGQPALTHQISYLMRRFGIAAPRNPIACDCREDLNRKAQPNVTRFILKIKELLLSLTLKLFQKLQSVLFRLFH
jgi:hypothetical protein